MDHSEPSITEPSRFFAEARLARRGNTLEHTLEWQFSNPIPEWNTLPLVVLVRVLHYLEADAEDVARFSATCTTWNQVATSPRGQCIAASQSLPPRSLV
jgi:hypothetical protein